MAKNKNKNPILIGETQSSLIKEDVKLLSIDYSQFKASHWGICGKSGSGKTRALTSVLFWTIKDSIIEYYEDLSRNPDTFIFLDPHASSLPPLLSLLKDFYSAHPEYSRTSHIQNFKKKSSDPDGWNVYLGHYIEKSLKFNPLVSKKLSYDYSYLEKAVNLNISALKCIFDFSSFWPRNSEAIETIIKTFLLINAQILRESSNESLLSYKDIYEFFSILKTTGKLPNWINTYLKPFFESPDKETQTIANSIYSQLKLFPVNLSWNKEYYDTTITKFKDFSWEFGTTFGYWANYDDLTLDLEIVYGDDNIETRCFFLDLSSFSNQERRVIVAFFYNASYFIWNLKNHQKSIGTHWVICDEFQSFLELKGQKNPLIDLLEKGLNENRKYKIFYLFVLQSVGSELKDLMNNLGYLFIFALPPEQAELFTDILSFGIDGSSEENVITEKHISNLGRGSFFASFDTIEYGLLTVVSKSLDINDPKIRKLLIG